MLLSVAIEGFLLSSQANGMSLNTISDYKIHLLRMTEYLMDPELEKITSMDILRFYAWLQRDYRPSRSDKSAAPLSPSSIRNCWCAIRSFYNWATRELKIQRVDMSIKAPRWTPPEISGFTVEEIKALIKATEHSAIAKPKDRKSFVMKTPHTSRDKALILILLDTGLRVGEVARLKVEDVNLASGDVYIRPFGTGIKTKSRHVYIGSSTIKALWLYVSTRKARPEEPLFLSSEGNEMNRESIHQVLDRIAARAGVKDVYPHRFRHTFAIEFLRNGGDVFNLQRLLGHSTLDMVKRYLALSNSDAAAAHKKASPADRWKL
jgi:integrase/recombinase XerD